MGRKDEVGARELDEREWFDLELRTNAKGGS